jgi:hypothetical protein
VVRCLPQVLAGCCCLYSCSAMGCRKRRIQPRSSSRHRQQCQHPSSHHQRRRHRRRRRRHRHPCSHQHGQILSRAAQLLHLPAPRPDGCYTIQRAEGMIAKGGALGMLARGCSSVRGRNATVAPNAFSHDHLYSRNVAPAASSSGAIPGGALPIRRRRRPLEPVP